MTWACLASASMAAAAGSMPFSAWRKKSGGPEPFSTKSIRVPLTTSDCASRDDATVIPPPKSRVFSVPAVVLAREMPFATARAAADRTGMPCAAGMSRRLTSCAGSDAIQVRKGQGRAASMTADSVTTHLAVTYATHDGVELQGDLYLPKGAKAAPALVAVHGGGWVQGVRAAFQYWGPYLAARGYAVFAISYRLATKGKTFPQAVQDVLAGVQFVRGKAGEFGIDPQRIGLLGASAGGHLASLAALSGKKFAGGYPQDPFASVSTEVKALVGVYGVYDMVAMWTTYQIQGGVDNNIQKFLGASPMENRQLYFDASSASYATFANNKIGVLLVTGTQDDLVDPKQHTEPFTLALKQAGFFVRPCIVQGAPHYWMNDPIEEPTSYSGFLAPRLLRFLAEKL